MTRNLKMQINDMIRAKATLVDIMNYLFASTDYSELKIIHILTTEFNMNEKLIISTFAKDYGVEIQ